MSLRLSILAFSTLFACASLAATAQVTPPDPPKAAAKADPGKDEKKKPAAKKPAPRPVAKKSDATKAAAAPKKPIEVKLMNTDKPLVLKDKEGNVIPTSPDAYNVDSALPKKR